MAQRDYVKKKLDRCKKQYSSLTLNFMIAISAIIVVLFVVVLYAMTKTKPESKPMDKESASTEKPQTTLPEKPQERWTYLKQLENPDHNNDETKNDNTTPLDSSEREQIINTFRDKQEDIPLANHYSKRQKQTNQKSPMQSSTDNTNTIETQWFIQCGAFKDSSNAESLKARIAMAGFDSHIEKKTLYRILVGYYKNKESAEKVIKQLRDAEIGSCIVNKKHYH